MANGLILGGAERAGEASLTSVPDGGCISEDGEDYHIENCPALGPIEASDGVAKNLKGFDS